jgi:hypothetical protein
MFMGGLAGEGRRASPADRPEDLGLLAVFPSPGKALRAPRSLDRLFCRAASRTEDLGALAGSGGLAGDARRRAARRTGAEVLGSARSLIWNKSNEPAFFARLRLDRLARAGSPRATSGRKNFPSPSCVGRGKRLGSDGTPEPMEEFHASQFA